MRCSQEQPPCGLPSAGRAVRGACEQVKNSLRAVNDRFEDADVEPPPVRVVVAEGDEDVTIKARFTCVSVRSTHAVTQHAAGSLTPAST